MHSLPGLLEPRSGPVDPKTCELCATLLSRLEKSGYERDLELFHSVINDMDVHATFGHPGDRRYPGQGVHSAGSEVHSQAKKRKLIHRAARWRRVFRYKVRPRR